MSWEIKIGDALEVLRTLPEESVHCVVTSPPYWGLRDYGTATWVGGSPECEHREKKSLAGNGGSDKQRSNTGANQVFAGDCECGAIRKDGQLGLEKTPEEYVAKMVRVFAEVRRVLRKDGTLWLNLGDSYAGSWGNYRPNSPPGKHGQRVKDTARWNRPAYQSQEFLPPTANIKSCKPKDLVGIPWLVAFALRADGWWLRQDIIWSKPNPMPESVTDRCTKAHEYLFLLSKSPRYYFNQEAIREPLKDASVARLIQDVENQKGSDRIPGKTNGNMKAVRFGGAKYGDDESEQSRTKSGKEWTPNQAGSGGINANRSGYFDKDSGEPLCGVTANKKSVWTVTTQGYNEAHFATFPPKLAEPCILAGCPQNETVLDPFAGAGTTGLVATRLGRNFIGIELKPEYAEMARRRITEDAPLFNAVLP